MATVSIDDGILFVELRVWDKILSVHGSLRVPLTHVKRAEAGPAPPIPWFTKLVGANIPGVKAAGTFWDTGGFAFYDYSASSECLLLELEHEFYKRAVIEIDPPQNPTDCAMLINTALAQPAPPA